MTIPRAKRILIVPLDWGLGHTTRCIPIISHIISLGHIPVFAGNDNQRTFIEKTFPSISFIHLDGYNITYSEWNQVAQIGLLSQLPRLKKVIKTEHAWLLQTAKELEIDGIISDNRYGLYHSDIPCVILTHQLQIKTGMGKLADNLLLKIHYTYLNRFLETWVVDTPSAPDLSGELAHPKVLPKRTIYIGLLSRFEKTGEQPADDGSLLILLSGPEPQRSILSAILWKQVQQYKGNIIFVEGSESAKEPPFIPAHILYHKQLTGEELLPLMKRAQIVLCRSGYSTIMDLVAIGRKAILIPTPGQTEQEYLAKYHNKNGTYYTMPQRGFNLQKALASAQNFPFNKALLTESYSGYKKVVADWLQLL